MGRPGQVDNTFEQLLHMLAAGHWPAGRALPSSLKLARELGVCQPTLLKAARKAAACGLLRSRCGQAPVTCAGTDELARTILQRRAVGLGSHRLAVLVPAYQMPLRSNLFYYAIVRALLAAARPAGLTTRVVPWPLAAQHDIARRLARGRFAAAICIGSRQSFLSGLAVLARNRFPTVMLNRLWPGLQLPAVRADHYGAARQLVEKLLDLGHRNICLVSGRARDALNHFGYPTVFEGWTDCLLEHGLLNGCARPVYVVPPPPVNPFGGEFQHWLNGPDRPTALVFESGYWAAEFLKDPAFARLRIPRQISLVAFDQLQTAPLGPRRIRVTACRMNSQRTAECLVETVLKLLGGDPDPPSIRVPLDFDITDSLGPAPAAPRSAAQFLSRRPTTFSAGHTSPPPV